jgi:spore germination protein YaaH
MMARRTAGIVLVAVASASLAAPAQAATGDVCAKASGLAFHRQVGKFVGRLSWKPARASARYRVYRDGAIVGQTFGRSLRVAVAPGRTYVFSVRALRSSGRVSDCAAEMTRTLSFYPPFRPRKLAIKRATKRTALLVWAPAHHGDGRIAGYRVYRNGSVYRQVKHRRLRVRLVRGRSTVLWVAAADTRGNVSRFSRSVRVRINHRRPGPPSRLRAVRVTDTEVTLGWAASARRSSRIVGYRVYRDGKPLRQAKGLSNTVSNLAPATPYRFTVAAVDSLGYQSARTAPLAVSTTVPPPTRGSVHAFLLASTGESFRDLQRHYRQIGTVYPTYFDCYAPSQFQGADDPLVTRWSQLRRIAVMPRFDCQSPVRLHAILTDPATRAATISTLVSVVRDTGYDGLNLDFEAGYATDRDALTSFVGDLASQLHALGKRLSVCVSAKYTNTTTGRSGFYDYADLGAVADNIFVMDWGWHWTTSGPGAIDDMNYFVPVADYVASMPNKNRFVLGVGLFGIDWPDGGGSSNPGTPLEYADTLALIARTGAQPFYNGLQGGWHLTYYDGNDVQHDVWYGDATSYAVRFKIARDRGLEIGLWRLGTEHQALWDDPRVAPAP